MLAKSSQPRTIKYFLSSPPSGDLEWKVKGSACCDLSPPERVSLTLFFSCFLFIYPPKTRTQTHQSFLYILFWVVRPRILTAAQLCFTSYFYFFVCMRERHSLFTRGQSSAAVVAHLCHSAASQETLLSRSQISSRLHPGCCSSLPVLDANQKLHQVEN